MVFVKLKLFFQSLEFQCTWKDCFILLEIKSKYYEIAIEIRSTLFPSCNNERELFIKKKMTRVKGKLNEIFEISIIIILKTNLNEFLTRNFKHESIEEHLNTF